MQALARIFFQEQTISTGQQRYIIFERRKPIKTEDGMITFSAVEQLRNRWNDECQRLERLADREQSAVLKQRFMGQVDTLQKCIQEIDVLLNAAIEMEKLRMKPSVPSNVSQRRHAG